ncbi:MAG TPA: hypothetical protein VK752_20575 [Bryobacteraceae bacterium]|jgi:hypothetical protein|nr:hypothetical protein [Bryobacteraceae bacterium]
MPDETDAKPPQERLAQAVRDLIQEELHRPAPKGEELPSFEKVLWIGVILANIVLLITQVPDQILKDTSFEFASKLIGYVFGGLLLVYSSWAREQIMKLVRVRWFQACQITLLILLLFLRVHVVFIHPNVEPAGAQLWVDGEAVRFKRGGSLGLSFRTHDIKVVPPAESKDKPYQFTIRRWDLVRGAFGNRDTARWTPLYQFSFKRRFIESSVELLRDGSLFEGILESQPANVEFDPKGYLKVLSDPTTELGTVYLPLGTYTVREVMKDGKACRALRVNIQDIVNELQNQLCPAQ